MANCDQSLYIRYLCLTITFFLRFQLGLAGFPASLNSSKPCPTPFTHISQGCYYFETNPLKGPLNWTDAVAKCKNMSSTKIFVHLMSLETQAEAAVISSWVTGDSSIQIPLWIDGYLAYTPATTYTPEGIQSYWSWSGQIAFEYPILQSANYKPIDGFNMLLFWNGTGNEYRTSSRSAEMFYVCEASVSCKTSDNVCKNNGTCFVNSGNVLCICPTGYSGELCQIPVDYCDVFAPCQHGSSCTSYTGSYTCQCTEFYTGKDCTVETSYKLETLRKILFAVSNSIVVLLVGLLCLMDLPWNGLIKKAKEKFGRDDEENEEEKRSNRGSVGDDDDMQESSGHNSTEIAAEVEMLKKLQKVVSQSDGSEFQRQRTMVMRENTNFN